MNAQASYRQKLEAFFSDHEIQAFCLTVGATCLLAYLMAAYLPALVVGILLAYLLNGLVNKLHEQGFNRLLSISGTLLVSIIGLAMLMLYAAPQITAQMTQLTRQYTTLVQSLPDEEDQEGDAAPEAEQLSQLSGYSMELRELANSEKDGGDRGQAARLKEIADRLGELAGPGGETVASPATKPPAPPPDASSDDGKSRISDWLLKTPQGQRALREFQKYLSSFTETLTEDLATNVRGVLQLVIYLVLIPMLIFFLLRDKDTIIHWCSGMLPRSRMLENLKDELDQHFAAYVRGKIIEALMVFGLCLIAFFSLRVGYAFILAVAVGLSVIIPFVGAVVVTIPVVLIGYAEFGLDTGFWWLIGAYALIQILDGQVIVPLLFSEVVNLHPAAILVAILVFGTLWGIWGVFFAIPLASLIKACINVIEKKVAAAPAPT
ncbi:MAG: AI-2E family transporter [Betaproteobacteria bacterium AqS2]|uniref:AI-2E family transporter n=1 Tax=Candidatus Amphirhobacter heronislandensis TaxID=1732024 RepID=A0A930UEZ8_9GAMM|nr:AI-2E family transporter [Betaproteobacteria bacterium AqS2]